MANKNTTVTKSESKPWGDKEAWILSALSALAYYFYSTKSPGYYQHDEIAHYFSMLEFWDDPNTILGNWAKTGYKLVYVIPALLGSKFLLLLNCLVSAFTVWLTYKTASLFTKKYALLAALLLATQPFWIELSFRNYADSFSGLVLLGAVFFHYKNKLIPAALLLSYGCLIRQEFYIIGVVYGVYHLLNKKWAPAFLLALFPVLYNFWGYLHTGELLYLIEDTRKTSEVYADQFGKHGFFHFWRTSFVYWGPVVVTLGVLFFSILIGNYKKEKARKIFELNPVFIWVPLAIYFLLHSLFNWEALSLAASPNLRYMNAIGPLAAILGAIGLEAWPALKDKRTPYLISLGGFLLLAVAFMAYKDNGVVLLSEEEQSFGPWLIALATVVLLLVKLEYKTLSLILAALSLVGGVSLLQPKKFGEEDKTMKNMVKWLAKEGKDQQHVLTNHTLFQYFYEKEEGHAHPHQTSIDSAYVHEAPVGSVLIIDSHYSLRKDFPAPSTQIRDNYLQTRDFSQAINAIIQENNGDYQVINQFTSADQRFGAIVLEKTK